MSRSLSTNCGSVGELELLHPVRLKAVRTPDALDGTRADIDDLRHHGRGLAGRLGRRVGLGEHHDTLSDGRSQRLGARGLARQG